MSTERTSVRDLDLRTLAIVNHNSRAVIDLRPVTMEFNVYASMYNNFMTADVTIVDAEGLIERLPIIGEEVVVMEFSLPDHDPRSNVTFRKAFHVYKVDNRMPYEERAELYTLRLCSIENIIALASRVDRAYTDKRIDEIIRESFTEYVLQDNYYRRFTGQVLRFVRGQLGRVGTTRGKHALIGNGSNPFEFMNYLCEQASSDGEEDASDYIFYEDKNGYHFQTVSTLLGHGASGNIYRAETDVIKDGDDTPGFPADAVIAEEVSIEENVDVIRAHTGGMYQNHVAAFDPLLKRIWNQEYSYDADMYDRTVNNSALSTVDRYRLNSSLSYFNRPKPSLSQYVIGNIRENEESTYADQGYLAGRVSDSHGNDLDTVSKSPFLMHEVLNRRTTKGSVMDNAVKVNVTVPGDPTVDPGMIVNLFVPQTTLNDELRTRYNVFFGESDPRFLVSSVSHRYDLTTGRFRTFLHLMKDSYGRSVQSAERLQGDLFT